MTKQLKAKSLHKHRLVLQAALCVEDLLLAMEKDGGRPWIAIVHDHMESLFKDREKEKYKRSKAKSCATR